MSNLAIITMSEDHFKTLLINGAFDGIKYTSKVLPDDSELSDHEAYQAAKKAYRKARDLKETLAFNLTTNK